MDLQVKLKNEADLKRGAYRACVPGLEAHVHELGRSLAVRDISASGLGVLDPDGALREGESYRIDLFLSRKAWMEKVAVKVVRTAPEGLAGVAFEGLGRREEAALDKLILEVQKRLIALRKKKDEEKKP